MLCYGIPIGNDKYVSHMLNLKVKEIADQTEHICHTLQNDK